MIKPNAWSGLQQWCDAIVDARFAEGVLMIPWADPFGIYVDGEQGPDLTRKIIDTFAVFVSPGASLIGESGRATGGGFDTKLLEDECWISIVKDNIGSLHNWRAGDRVYLKDRNQWYNISYFAPEATRRPNFHLIQINDMLSGTDAPAGQVMPAKLYQLYFNATSKRFYRAMGLSNTAWQLI